MNDLALNAFVLHRPVGQGGPLRWTASAIMIVALHLGLIAVAIAWYQQSPPPGAASPAILIDLAPAASAPAVSPQDLAPGPQMEQTPPPAPDPEPPPPQALQQNEPVPVAPKPEAQVPPPQRAPPAPEPGKIMPERARPVPPKPAKPKPVQTEAKHAEQRPAPRSSAAPRPERRAALAAPVTAGIAAAAVLPSYRDRLAAHLQRYKQYPAGAKAAGEQGTAMLSFTVGRSGNVLASRLAGSSGHPALDAETMAMIRRAQPLPSFPPELTQSSLSFTVPVRFSIR